MANEDPAGEWWDLIFGGMGPYAEFYLADVSIVSLVKNVFPAGYLSLSLIASPFSFCLSKCGNSF
jgi:hypothetical protein